MDKIVGIEASKPPRLKKQGDLLYHEGPLLSHFVDEDDAKNHYLYKWADCDEQANRWLVAAVPENMLLDYLTQSISLLSLFRYSAKLFVLDVDDALNEIAFLECSFENIPSTYLPGPQSLFHERKCEKYALTLRENILAGRDINYSLITDWVDAGQPKPIDEVLLDATALLQQSREAFDTLLSGYSKKKVFDSFFKSFTSHDFTVSIQPFPPRSPSATQPHFPGVVLLIEIKHYSTKIARVHQNDFLDFMQQEMRTGVYLRDTDTAVLKLPRYGWQDSPNQNVRGQLREYVYKEYHSALEEDDMVGNTW